MKSILVTGAAGFIGSKTIELLLQNQYKVIGVDNLNNYYDIKLKKHRLRKLQAKDNFSFYEIDISNLNQIKEVFNKHNFDAVINLAARAGVRYSLVNPFVYLSTNSLGTLNLLELMKEYDVKKFVLASTSSLYAGQKSPFVESLPVNEPISPYSASKKAAEALAYTYHYQYDIDVSILRYFTVYGPAGRPDMSVFRFISWIDNGEPILLFGDGSQSRDFTFVDDIAEGTILALKKVGFEVINLGGGNNPISMNTLISMIEEKLGKKAIINQQPFHKADMEVTWADITKAKRILDWQPKTTLLEGIEKTILWYNQNREWLSTISLDCPCLEQEQHKE